MRSPARTGVVRAQSRPNTPTLFCVRSISGNRRKIYDCRMTCSTVAHAVLRTEMISCASGRAYATSTSSGSSVAEDIDRALAEGVVLSVGVLVVVGVVRVVVVLVGVFVFFVVCFFVGLFVLWFVSF